MSTGASSSLPASNNCYVCKREIKTKVGPKEVILFDDSKIILAKDIKVASGFITQADGTMKEVMLHPQCGPQFNGPWAEGKVKPEPNNELKALIQEYKDARSDAADKKNR